jgi:hypothetical protein
MSVTFYVRKSLRAGPFMFNVSKSGIGVSVGVPGFRVGSGPRGNYVRMGRSGLYYRATQLSTGRARAAEPQPQAPCPTFQPLPPASAVVIQEVTGASVSELASAVPSDLVTQLQAAATHRRIAPLAAIALIVLAVPLGTVGLVVLLACIPAVVWLALRDRARQSVVVFYDVTDSSAEQFQSVVDAVAALAQCQGTWFVSGAGNVQTTYQYKVNSGASTIVSRSPASVGMKAPRHLVTNIAVPTLIGRQFSVHFLPDRVLLRDGRRYADMPYTELCADANPHRFIETGSVPGDSQQVGTTWRFVNVNGGPDRRFNNNCQLPIMIYCTLTFTSQQGLRLVFDFSRPQVTQAVAATLRAASAAPTPAIQP